MKLALIELRRRPGRFVAAVAILGALAVLLMFLGGLLDGLLASSTGAFRAQQADVVVYSADARDSLPRSRIDPALRDAVGTAPGLAQVGGLGSVQLGARPEAAPDARELIATAVIGYELAPAGLPTEPPAEGQVIADDSIRADDVEIGDVLLLGPARSPVEIAGFVSDTQYSGQATLWASLATWRAVTAENRPDLAFGDGSVQALVARVEGGSADEVAAAIDGATDGATATRPLAAAIDALPGVQEQRSTFNQIIAVTAVVAAVVIALFFALITVERSGLYGVLKAVGASSAGLFAGVAAQAVILALVASAIGIASALVLDAVIPAGALPFQVTWSRLLTSAGLMIAAAVIGSAFSLRRVVRIDPATAIGASS